MGVAYLNEELGLPVRLSTGEGGCPPQITALTIFKICDPADCQRLFRLG